MPPRAAEDSQLPSKSTSKSATDAERKASGTRSGDFERLWHRPFLAKARKQRSGDNPKQQQKLENASVEVVSGKRRRGNPLEEIHGPGALQVAGSSTGPRSRPSQRSRLLVSKRVDRHAEKAYGADCTTDLMARLAEEDHASSSDDNTHLEPDTIIITRSVRHQPRNHPNPPSGDRKRVRDLEKELDAVRKLAAEKADEVDILKKEISQHRENLRIQADQIEKLKKSEEVAVAAQSHLQCQICLELLSKPFALAPCGHVLCQGCLQSWFRDAPPQDGEEGPGGEPIPPVYRKKICPCCRSHIVLRPIPVFALKNLVGLFPREGPQADDADGDEDPWEGIFFEQRSAADMDEDDDDYESAESDEDEYEDPYVTEYQSDGSSAEDRFMINEEYFSGEEGANFDTDDEGEESGYMDLEVDSDVDTYNLPEWSPPYYRDEVDQYRLLNLTRNELELLQRGANIGMIDNFQMSINRDFGIVARTEDGTYVLGWNIAKPATTDLYGEEFMDWVKMDVVTNPASWYIVSGRGVPCHWRLHSGSGILGIDEDEDDSD